MLTEERNELFMQYKHLINYSIKKNYGLIRSFKLSYDDVCQELSIEALKAIESYDITRGMAIHNYILYKLDFGVKTILTRNNRKCRIANLITVSLDNTYDDSDEPTIEIPVEVDYDSDLNIREAFDLLSEPEIEVVTLRLNGIGLSDKRQKMFMNRVKRKFIKFQALQSV